MVVTIGASSFFICTGFLGICAALLLFTIMVAGGYRSLPTKEQMRRIHERERK